MSLQRGKKTICTDAHHTDTFGMIFSTWKSYFCILNSIGANWDEASENKQQKASSMSNHFSHLLLICAHKNKHSKEIWSDLTDLKSIRTQM